MARTNTSMPWTEQTWSHALHPRNRRHAPLVGGRLWAASTNPHGGLKKEPQLPYLLFVCTQSREDSVGAQGAGEAGVGP